MDIVIAPHDILRWFHVICAAYWLGGEWGVFNACTNVARTDLPLDERERALNVAYNIDIMPRSAIIWLLPAGFHMADNYGLSPVTGMGVNIVWGLVAAWWCLIFSTYKLKGTPLGIKLHHIDDGIRFFVIPALISVGSYMLITGTNPTTGETLAQSWFAVKMTLFGSILIIGLIMRFVMVGWVKDFISLKADGASAAIDGKIYSTLMMTRKLAYLYWVLIGTMAFIGVTKPI